MSVRQINITINLSCKYVKLSPPPNIFKHGVVKAGGPRVAVTARPHTPLLVAVDPSSSSSLPHTQGFLESVPRGEALLICRKIDEQKEETR